MRFKKTIVPLLLMATIIIASCKENASYSISDKNVYYLSDTSNVIKDYRNDTIAIYFISYFDHDTVQIYVNDDLLTKKVISTSAIGGSALLEKIGSIRQVKRIGIKLNNNEIVGIRCDKNNQLFIINLDKKKNYDCYGSYFISCRPIIGWSLPLAIVFHKA